MSIHVIILQQTLCKEKVAISQHAKENNATIGNCKQRKEDNNVK